MADRFLIVSDLDGTLLGDDQALEELAAWLTSLREPPLLVYNSGRSTSSQRASIAATFLPKPDVLVGNMGTQVERFEPREPFGDWPSLVGPWEESVVREVLAEIGELELQPEVFLSPHKVSYFVHNAAEAKLLEWRSLLEAAGQAVRLVYSSNRDLDVLPAGLDKGAAAAFLSAYWSMPHDRVIVCGDTANDLSMFERGFLGVVVGNALPELKALDSSRVYSASGNCASGVLEGLRYWFERSESGRTRPV